MSSPVVSGESGALVSSLNAQRDHVLGILDGLPDEALRRRVLPSGWTCLGLVRRSPADHARARRLRLVDVRQVARRSTLAPRGEVAGYAQNRCRHRSSSGMCSDGDRPGKTYPPRHRRCILRRHNHIFCRRETGSRVESRQVIFPESRRPLQHPLQSRGDPVQVFREQ
jgi:Protein of unknown function (DUF664)